MYETADTLTLMDLCLAQSSIGSHSYVCEAIAGHPEGEHYYVRAGLIRVVTPT